MDALKQVLDSFDIPADLRWTWGEGGTERTLEKSWTDIVHSHEVTERICFVAYFYMICLCHIDCYVLGYLMY